MHKLVNMNLLNYSKIVGSQVANITKENLNTLIGSILCSEMPTKY